MPPFSENRDTILNQLKNSEEAAGTLIAGLSDAQLNWQPNDGRSWSIWQCLDHLARTNRVYGQAMLEAIAHPGPYTKATKAITPGWFGRWFITRMEPSAQTRYNTVKKVMPGPAGNGQAVMREFADSHAEARHVVASWEQADLNQNPFVPLLRFTVVTGLMIINAHDRRHLSQAERVKQSAGYPAA